MDATIIVVEDEPGTRATLCGILMEDAAYNTDPRIKAARQISYSDTVSDIYQRSFQNKTSTNLFSV